MKKILNYSFLLLVFCLTSLLGGLSFNTFENFESVSAASTIQEIDSAKKLREYVGNYTASNANDTIVLTANIDMTNETVTTNTIGTEDAPFAGTFDGRGYTIKNYKANLQNTEETTMQNQFAGLFGVTTTGVSIKNVALDGTWTLKTGGTENAYVGGLVGKSIGTTIENVQISAKFDYQTDYESNIYFGSLIGYAQNCTIENVICRSTDAKKFELSSNSGKILNFGGIIGGQSNTTLQFAVVSVVFSLNVNVSFDGEINLGGVSGVVNQGGSKIVNVVCENTYSVTNNSSVDVLVGEVAGLVSNPSPDSGNLSYIHFKENTGIERFGYIGNYTYKKNDSYDFITVQQGSMDKDGKAYFSKQVWDSLLGDWDFDNVWGGLEVGNKINLQCFNGDFVVRISSSLNTDVLTMKTNLQTSYRYGDEVEMEFSFNDITEYNETTEQDNVVGNMREFFNISSIYLNSKEVAQIITVVSEDSYYYRVQNSDDYEIVTDAENNAFTLKILKVTAKTSGDYSITTEAKSFKGQISSRLFDKEDNLTEGEIPGYVFYAESPSTTTESLTLTKMTYGTTCRIETRVKPKTANSFVGWYLVTGENTSQKLGANRVLELTFGKNGITKDCEIFAKYSVNACRVTFKLDEGIDRIELYSGNTEIKDSGEIVPISKEESSLKLEIYVLKNYDFDVDQFITELDTYKTKDPTKTFCTLRESYDTEDYHYYHFILDMTTLEGGFADEFTIDAKTTLSQNNDNVWIWYVVGGVGGAIVLGGAIFLIVFLSRRHGGGRSSGGSFKKKNYKNMYF